MLRRSSVAILLFPLSVSPLAANADSTYRSLPFFQDWSDTAMIKANNDWTGVPGILGYRGDNLVTTDGGNPATIVAPGVGTPFSIIANQANPHSLASGGIAEFELADPSVALQGSSTADAPFLLLHLDTRGWHDIHVQYQLRDLDGSSDNAVQPVALQYRLGESGDFTNLAAAFVADATAGPSLVGLMTPVSTVLPVFAAGADHLQLRFITANAVGSDEWVGVDRISISGTPVAAVPEPGEWLLMLSGLGILGLMSKRRLTV